MTTTSGKLPGIKLLGDWSEGEDGWADGANSNWLTLSVLTQATALDIVDEVPFTPAEADIYILSATASLNTNQIAVYHKSQWTYITPSVGFKFFIQSKQLQYTYGSSGWVEETTGGATKDDIATAVAAEAKLRSDADNALAESISQETDRAQQAEQTLATAVSGVSDSVTNVSQAVSKETTDRQTADSNLSQAITQETSRAKTAETALQTSITDEITRSTAEDSRLNIIAQLSVIDIVDTLPTTPADGDIYILSSAATADANKIAIYTTEWAYIQPSVGFIAYVKQKSDYYTFNASWNLTFNSSSGSYIQSVPVSGSTNIRITDMQEDSSGNIVVTRADGTTQSYAPGSAGIIPATSTLGAVYWTRTGNILTQSFQIVAAYDQLYQAFPFTYAADTVPVVTAAAALTVDNWSAGLMVASPGQTTHSGTTNSGILLRLPCWYGSSYGAVAQSKPITLNLTVMGEV